MLGPHPLSVEYLPYHTVEKHPMHDVRPGLGGWAQVNGRNSIHSWEERFQ
ncbi:MAG: sugar transferase [Lachnospiraceae bacterium]|nr:sugar transferase [Lachnospiraceae bacterium]